MRCASCVKKMPLREVQRPAARLRSPVILGVLTSLALFFWLSDLGPALVIGCLFLTMYSIARNRVLLAAAGLAVIIIGIRRRIFDRLPAHRYAARTDVEIAVG